LAHPFTCALANKLDFADVTRLNKLAKALIAATANCVRAAVSEANIVRAKLQVGGEG